MRHIGGMAIRMQLNDQGIELPGRIETKLMNTCRRRSLQKASAGKQWTSGMREVYKEKARLLCLVDIYTLP